MMELWQKPSNSKRHASHMSFRINRLKKTKRHSSTRPGVVEQSAIQAPVAQTACTKEVADVSM
jgi:hypothetical protein